MCQAADWHGQNFWKLQNHQKTITGAQNLFRQSLPNIESPGALIALPYSLSRVVIRHGQWQSIPHLSYISRGQVTFLGSWSKSLVSWRKRRKGDVQRHVTGRRSRGVSSRSMGTDDLVDGYLWIHSTRYVSRVVSFAFRFNMSGVTRITSHDVAQMGKIFWRYGGTRCTFCRRCS